MVLGHLDIFALPSGTMLTALSLEKNYRTFSISCFWGLLQCRRLPQHAAPATLTDQRYPEQHLQDSSVAMAQCLQGDVSTAFCSTLEKRFPASSASVAPRWLVCQPVNQGRALPSEVWTSALPGVHLSPAVVAAALSCYSDIL